MSEADEELPVEEAFSRLVSGFEEHGDANISRTSEGIAFSAHLRSIGLNDEAAHLLLESQMSQTADEAEPFDEEKGGWLFLGG